MRVTVGNGGCRGGDSDGEVDKNVGVEDGPLDDVGREGNGGCNGGMEDEKGSVSSTGGEGEGEPQDRGESSRAVSSSASMSSSASFEYVWQV